MKPTNAEPTLKLSPPGYTQFMWRNILEWPQDEYCAFLRDMRHVLSNRTVHGYMILRYVYGRKPAAT